MVGKLEGKILKVLIETKHKTKIMAQKYENTKEKQILSNRLDLQGEEMEMK